MIGSVSLHSLPILQHDPVHCQQTVCTNKFALVSPRVREFYNNSTCSLAREDGRVMNAQERSAA